jgi:ADP-ribosylglycohydrolase
MRCGGDNQTVPEIACCFLGAEMGPDIFDTKVIKDIEKANNLDIYGMLDSLTDRASI